MVSGTVSDRFMESFGEVSDGIERILAESRKRVSGVFRSHYREFKKVSGHIEGGGFINGFSFLVVSRLQKTVKRVSEGFQKGPWMVWKVFRGISEGF